MKKKEIRNEIKYFPLKKKLMNEYWWLMMTVAEGQDSYKIRIKKYKKKEN